MLSWIISYLVFTLIFLYAALKYIFPFLRRLVYPHCVSISFLPGITIPFRSLSCLCQVEKENVLKYGRVLNPFNGLLPFERGGLQIAHPKLIREMLQSDYLSFDRPHPFVKPFSDFSSGLIQQPNGQEWKEARKMFDLFFTTSAIRSYEPILQEEVEQLLKSIRQEREARGYKASLDVQPFMNYFTFDSITHLVFGRSIHSQSQKGSSYLTSFKYCLSDQMRRFIVGLFLPEWLNFKASHYTRHMEHFRSLVTRYFKESSGSTQEQSGSTDQSSGSTTEQSIDPSHDQESIHFHSSILGRILNEKQQLVPEWMWKNKNQLVHQLVSILFAGHDTTTNLLSWICYFLASRPDLQETILLEIQPALDPQSHRLSLDKLESCSMLNAVIKETLRLRPSAPSLPRIMARDYRFEWKEQDNDYYFEMKKGDFLGYLVYATHLHPSNWPDRPEEFWPERWLVSAENQRTSGSTLPGGATSAYAYIPFGYGPRRCVGERLALAEARLVTASLIHAFRLEKDSSWIPNMVQLATMSTSNGIGIRFKDRP